MSSSDIHHEIALQKVGSPAGKPGRFDVGLFHTAFEVTDKQRFAGRYKKLVDHDIRVATVDHRISWAMYFSDPDGNGLEIYCDTREEPDGTKLWQGKDRPLSSQAILDHLA